MKKSIGITLAAAERGLLDLLKDVSGIHTYRPANVNKFNHIKKAFASLVFGHEGLRTPKYGCQICLSDASIDSRLC